MYGDLGRHPQALSHYFRAHFGVEPDETPESVVITPLHFSSVIGAALPEALGKRGVAVQSLKTALSGFGDSFLATKGDTRALFSIGGVGASLALGHALLLAHAPRTKRVLFYGTCGSLAEHTQVYDLNVPERCIRGDRVTEDVYPLHVPAEGDKALCQEVRDRLGASLSQSGKRIHCDLHYSVSSIFVETWDMLRRLRDGQVNTIDMELSVYYTVLTQAGKSVAGILKVIDLPLKGIATYEGAKQHVSAEAKSAVNEAILEALCGMCGI